MLNSIWQRSYLKRFAFYQLVFQMPGTMRKFIHERGANLGALFGFGSLFMLGSLGQLNETIAAATFATASSLLIFKGHTSWAYSAAYTIALLGNIAFFGPAAYAGDYVAAALMVLFSAGNFLAIYNSTAHHNFHNSSSFLLRNTLGNPRRSVGYWQIILRAPWMAHALATQQWLHVAFIALSSIGSFLSANSKHAPAAKHAKL